jgi:hypothetical protein
MHAPRSTFYVFLKKLRKLQKSKKRKARGLRLTRKKRSELRTQNSLNNTKHFFKFATRDLVAIKLKVNCIKKRRLKI